jgi:hypothetical protein
VSPGFDSRHPRRLADAACPDRPDLPWDSDRSGADVERAVSVCWNECPVRVACLADAEAVETAAAVHGVRGGLTADERRRMVKVREA